MKRPVWRYAEQVATNAPLAVVRGRLEAMESALPLSVCVPRLLGRPPGRWVQESLRRAGDGLRVEWSARLGGLAEDGWIEAQADGEGSRLATGGRLKGWPLLWKVGLLGWRSESLLQRFVANL